MKFTTIFLVAAIGATLHAGAEPSINWSAGVDYTYDAAGNIRQIGTDHHVYDTAGRLVQSDTNGTRRKYEYDGFGNRTKCEQPGTDCQYGHTVLTATNRLTELGYDGAGNVTVFEGHQYQYDLLNMQTSRDLAAEYVYTADDERIAVYLPATGSWRWTLRDASANVLREMASHDGPAGQLGTSGWTWTKDYIWRGDRLLASRQVEPGAPATATYHYHLDHLGTPRRITNNTDEIVGVHDYHAFGPETAGGTNEVSLSLFKYTGHERDLFGAEGSETLDAVHARYYSGMAGRFQSVDPVLDFDTTLNAPQRWNRYGYANNNPLKYDDPDGKRTRVFIVDGGGDLYSQQGHAALYVETPNGNAGVSLGTPTNFSAGVDAFVRHYNDEGRAVSAYDMNLSPQQEEAIRSFISKDVTAGTDSSKNLQARLMLAENCATGVCNALAAGGVGSNQDGKRAATFLFGTERPFTLQENLESGPLSGKVRDKTVYEPGEAPRKFKVPGVPKTPEEKVCGACFIQ